MTTSAEAARPLVRPVSRSRRLRKSGFGRILVRSPFYLLIAAIFVFAVSRRRNLPKHSDRGVTWDQYSSQHPSSGSPPDIDLTPERPPAQPIVIKEVVKVKCRYCGSLIDSTAERCPFCGAPRT